MACKNCARQSASFSGTAVAHRRHPQQVGRGAPEFFSQELQRARHLVDEANEITREVRPEDHLHIEVEFVRDIMRETDESIDHDPRDARLHNCPPLLDVRQIQRASGCDACRLPPISPHWKLARSESSGGSVDGAVVSRGAGVLVPCIGCRAAAGVRLLACCDRRLGSSSVSRARPTTPRKAPRWTLRTPLITTTEVQVHDRVALVLSSPCVRQHTSREVPQEILVRWQNKSTCAVR